MSKVLKNKIFLKLLIISAILLQMSKHFSSHSNNIRISPIISTKEEVEEEEKKDPPAPGLSFGVPSAYGASGEVRFCRNILWCKCYDGVFTFYTHDNKKVKQADGSMNFGFGVGDPNQLAAEVSVGIISLLCQEGSSCFGADGTAG